MPRNGAASASERGRWRSAERDADEITGITGGSWLTPAGFALGPGWPRSPYDGRSLRRLRRRPYLRMHQIAFSPSRQPI
ncbi:MAG: hypothetical protein ACOC8F_02585, partial [Planctomycetota bacterium]